MVAKLLTKCHSRANSACHALCQPRALAHLADVSRSAPELHNGLPLGKAHAHRTYRIGANGGSLELLVQLAAIELVTSSTGDGTSVEPWNIQPSSKFQLVPKLMEPVKGFIRKEDTSKVPKFLPARRMIIALTGLDR
jgi:hypothetical protein